MSVVIWFVGTSLAMAGGITTFHRSWTHSGRQACCARSNYAVAQSRSDKCSTVRYAQQPASIAEAPPTAKPIDEASAAALKSTK
jgi:hypothetical protein